MNTFIIIPYLWVLNLSLTVDCLLSWGRSFDYPARHRSVLIRRSSQSGSDLGGVEYDADDARIVIDSIIESTLNKIYGDI